jgi:hypothetical protein
MILKEQEILHRAFIRTWKRGLGCCHQATFAFQIHCARCIAAYARHGRHWSPLVGQFDCLCGRHNRLERDETAPKRWFS